jgi:hypothetical protein
MEQPLKATFHNIDTRTREERYAARDRDLFEKSMLKARREQFFQYRDPGGITSPEPGAPMYAPPEDRFQRDFAAEMRKSKELKLQKMEVGTLCNRTVPLQGTQEDSRGGQCILLAGPMTQQMKPTALSLKQVSVCYSR